MTPPTHITLSEERKQRILDELVKLYHNKFDEELSVYQAERMLEFFVKSLGALPNRSFCTTKGPSVI